MVDFTTEEIQLVYRLLDVAAVDEEADVVTSAVFRAAAELTRRMLRSRTIHDPLPGQTRISEE